MKTCRWHKILAFWLLGVFFLNTTPREFIHLFTNHEDTHDTVQSQGLAFSSLHKHCGFLNIGVPPYEAARFEYHSLVVAIDWHYLLVPLQSPVAVTPSRSSLRGPPAAGMA